MRYVPDSNVALKWLLPEPHSDKAIRLRDDYHGQVHELLAPDVFPVEMLHALTRAERQKRIIGDGARTYGLKKELNNGSRHNSRSPGQSA
jgi:predicted nucleic acid-binding protein